MTLREAFANNDILRAHIVDDAYDEIPMVGIPAGVVNRFIGELDDPAYERACAVIGKAGAQEHEFVEALREPDVVQMLFAAREEFGVHSQILFGEQMADRETKKKDLAPLIKLLEACGIQCHTFGVSYAVETTEEPHLVFIDLRLLEDGSPISVDAAVEIFRKLRAHHQECQPFVFLMSTLVDPLKERRDEFRVQAKLFASQFESLEKRIFADEGELAYVLTRYAKVLPQLRSLQKSIENVGKAVHSAVTRVQVELKNLDLADYFVLHRNTASVEKIGLGTYISDLVLDYLVHEVENAPQIWDFARELDKLKPETFPRSRFAVTQAAGKIYSGTLLHATGRLDAELDRELGPSHGYFYMGDIFFPKTEPAGAIPKTALVIATPACDLVRPETLRDRTIFLCEGTVKLLSASSNVPGGHDNLPGVIIANPRNLSQQLLINWDKKKLHTWHAAQMDKFKEPEVCEWVRIGRLRPIYAVQLQHAITADLSRIGTQRAPNMLVPQGVEILIKKDDKWVSLDNDDSKDASTAAFSETENKSRTVFVFSDTTVNRVRRKLKEWVLRNGSDSNAVPAIANNTAPAANEPEDPIRSVAEVIGAPVMPNLEAPEAGALAEPRTAPPTTPAEAAPATSGVAALVASTPVQGPAPYVPMAAAQAAALLSKIMDRADFEQRLMYTEYVKPSKEDSTKAPESCAFPFVGADGLTLEESQAFAIVRPGKPSVYMTVGGGQAAKAEQTATVVFKMLKVVDLGDTPQPKAKKAARAQNVAAQAAVAAAPVERAE